MLISEETRTLINLLFGTPISFCFNMSLLYLERRGKIKKWEWSIIPSIYLISLGIFGYTAFVYGESKVHQHNALVVMSSLYAITLIFANVLQFREYFIILKNIKYYGDYSQQPLIKWTQWCLFLMTFEGIGLPIMIFNTSWLLRSLYGIYSLSIAFFYIFSFIGYSLSCYTKNKIYKGNYRKKKQDFENKSEAEKLEICREKKD